MIMENLKKMQTVISISRTQVLRGVKQRVKQGGIQIIRTNVHTNHKQQYINI